jgi:hypothetical protein
VWVVGHSQDATNARVTSDSGGAGPDDDQRDTESDRRRAALSARCSSRLPGARAQACMPLRDGLELPSRFVKSASLARGPDAERYCCA